ncbi:MAG: AAA family ATPase [Firmicutes bacterium]|nr:AAA family ATPase [Bacillota bacterium]
MKLDNKSCFLRTVSIEKPDQVDFPFLLPAIRQLNELPLHPNVTYLVGENGTGKSTILEGIAVALGFNAEGGSKNLNFPTTDSHSKLYNHLRFVRGHKSPKTGYFLRAESFYNVASHIDYLDEESAGLGKPIISSYGGGSLHQKSHGEGFLSLLVHRFGGNGLYLLDEPEAALSPARQLTVLARIHELVQQGSQFIIATHSPILMSYPDAIIYNLTDNGYNEVSYQETEHFTLTKEFLESPERFLRHLLG